MEAKKRKTLIILGSLLALGGAGFLIWKFGFKKDSSDVETDTDMDYSPDGYTPSGGSSGGSSTPEPEPEPKKLIKSNWDKVKEAMLDAGAAEYKDKVTKITDQSDVGLNLGAPLSKIRITAKPDGMFYLSLKQPTDADFKLVSKGRYYNGGKKLNVGYGVNKGRIVRGNNFFNNVVKTGMKE